MFKWIKDLFKKKENKDCNEEIGILDIRNNFIYTDNDYVISGLKIHSINTQLLSKAESKSLIRDLSAEISSEKEEMKYFTISRTVDITSLQEEIKQKIEDSDNVIRKNLLKNHLRELQNLSLNGEIIERQSFLMIHSKRVDNCEKNLLKRLNELSNKFERCGIKNEILDEYALIQLCNSFLNINYSSNEDFDISERIVILREE